MLYLYAITESRRVPAAPGLRGAPLKLVGDAGLYAVASEHDELRVEPNEADLWAHEAIVEDLMSDGSVLPMRFGSAVADEKALRGFLEERRRSLEQALERVRGAVELSVRVAVASEPDTQAAAEEPGSGTAYLLDRLKQQRHQTAMTARVHQPLVPLSRASTSWSGEPRRRLWKAAYLVGIEDIEAFTQQVDMLDAELGAASVLCTGPWPPYSFSSEESGR